MQTKLMMPKVKLTPQQLQVRRKLKLTLTAIKQTK